MVNKLTTADILRKLCCLFKLSLMPENYLRTMIDIKPWSAESMYTMFSIVFGGGIINSLLDLLQFLLTQVKFQFRELSSLMLSLPECSVFEELVYNCTCDLLECAAGPNILKKKSFVGKWNQF